MHCGLLFQVIKLYDVLWSIMCGDKLKFNMRCIFNMQCSFQRLSLLSFHMPIKLLTKM